MNQVNCLLSLRDLTGSARNEQPNSLNPMVTHTDSDIMGAVCHHTGCLDLAKLVRGTLCAELFRGPVRHVRASEQLFRPGDAADRLFLIRTGLVKQTTVSRRGDEFTLELFGPTDVFGEMCFRDHVHAYWATALEPTAIVSSTRAEFLEGLSRRPDLLQQFLDFLAARLIGAHTEIESLVFENVVQRLGRALLRLVTMSEGSGWIAIPQLFGHGELARLLGVRRETVTRAMRELRKLDVLQATRHGAVRVHRSRLRRWVSRSRELRDADRQPLT